MCNSVELRKFVGTTTGVAQKPFRVLHTRSSHAKQQSEAKRTKENLHLRFFQSHHNGSVVFSSGTPSKILKSVQLFSHVNVQVQVKLPQMCLAKVNQQSTHQHTMMKDGG